MKKNQSLWEIIPVFSYGFKRYFFVAILCAIATTALNALTPQIVRFTVDSVLGSEPPALPAYLSSIYNSLGGQGFFREHLLWIGFLMIIIALLSGVANYIFRTTVATGSQGFIKAMRDKLFSHIQRLPYSWHTAHQTGDIIQRVTGDMEVVKNFISNHMIEAVRIILLITVTLSLMVSMSPKLSLVAIAFIPIIIGYTGIFYGKISKQFMKTDIAEGELVSVVQENLTGVRVVRAFGREGHEMDKFDEKNNKFSDIWIGLGYTMGAYWGFGDFFTGLQTMTVLSVGTYLTVQGQLTLGELIAFLSYNTMLIWPIRGLGRVLSEMSKSGVSFERLAYILHAKEEDENKEGVTPSISGTIAYENVSYSYPDSNQEVLKNISFTVASGTTLGILGGTGSGKSTLVHLLNRLYDPTSGKITIDGIDTKEMQLSHLRSAVGMVLQEPFLYSKTIGENIGIATKLSHEEMIAAAETASIHNSIESFKDGYDTIVGERGVTLSGGQKQRVAIARMLSQKTPIMVFDDSLSALDSETDFAIRNALRNRPTNATTIIISHRITSIMHADQIIVLKDGSISEMGSHKELINGDGIYKQIYDIQFNSDDRFTEGGEN